MELLVWNSKPTDDTKFTFDLTPKELSNLKDELMEAINDETGYIFKERDGEAMMDAILGTLANWDIIIE